MLYLITLIWCGDIRTSLIIINFYVHDSCLKSYILSTSILRGLLKNVI